MLSQSELINYLENYGNKTAIAWKNQIISYAGLVDILKNWFAILDEKKIRAGQVIAINGDYSPQTSALLLALLANKNIIVPISQSSRLEKDKILNIAQVTVEFAFDENDNYEIIFKSNKINHPLLKRLIANNQSGLILFSSGSSGEKKAITLNSEFLLKKFLSKTKKPLNTLAFLLLDHIGGLNTLMHVLSHGGTLITTTTKNPRDICQAIVDYQIDLLPTTPTFINILFTSGAINDFDLSSLKLITYGTEPMPEATLKSLAKALPHVKLKQTYGLSETGILSTKSESHSSLWLELDTDVKYKIVNNILHIKKTDAFLGYLNAPSPLDADGWFITGDEVATKKVNGKLLLKILGRKSEIINVGGEKVYPCEVENILLQVDNIKDVTVYGKNSPVTGQIVCAKINLCNSEPYEKVCQRITQYCRNKLEPYKCPMLILIAEEPLFNERFKKSRQLQTTT